MSRIQQLECELGVEIQFHWRNLIFFLSAIFL